MLFVGGKCKQSADLKCKQMSYFRADYVSKQIAVCR